MEIGMKVMVANVDPCGGNSSISLDWLRDATVCEVIEVGEDKLKLRGPWKGEPMDVWVPMIILRPVIEMDGQVVEGAVIDQAAEPPTKGHNKTQYSLLDFDFLKQMADNMAKGIKDGRGPGDWMRLQWDQEMENKYIDALLRHALEDFDPVAVACNCMIIAWHMNQRLEGGER
jgi:hypothetical protein